MWAKQQEQIHNLWFDSVPAVETVCWRIVPHVKLRTAVVLLQLLPTVPCTVYITGGRSHTTCNETWRWFIKLICSCWFAVEVPQAPKHNKKCTFVICRLFPWSILDYLMKKTVYSLVILGPYFSRLGNFGLDYYFSRYARKINPLDQNYPTSRNTSSQYSPVNK